MLTANSFSPLIQRRRRWRSAQPKWASSESTAPATAAASASKSSALRLRSTGALNQSLPYMRCITFGLITPHLSTCYPSTASTSVTSAASTRSAGKQLASGIAATAESQRLAALTPSTPHRPLQSAPPFAAFVKPSRSKPTFLIHPSRSLPPD